MKKMFDKLKEWDKKNCGCYKDNKDYRKEVEKMINKLLFGG